MGARADSTIRVNVIGDAKSAATALDTTEAKVKGLGGSIKTLAAAGGLLVAGAAVVEFGGKALEEADRLGDATARLQLQLGDLSSKLTDTAEDFSKLGLSAQDVLELEAAFADAATAVQLADDKIADLADDAAATAAAIGLLTGQDPSTVIDLIGKAAGGSAKALKALGISLTDSEVEARALKDTGKLTADSLTDGEIAAAGYSLVLEKLRPKLEDATTGQADLEQKTSEVNAKMETLTGKIGVLIEGPMTTLVEQLLQAADGASLLATNFDAAIAELKAGTGPIGNVIDKVETLFRGFAQLVTILKSLTSGQFSIPNPFAPSPTVTGSPGGSPDARDHTVQSVTINVPPSGQSNEDAVLRALRDYEKRNGKTIL